MMIIRPARERGHTMLGWLTSWHSFSFGDYIDRHQMGFRSLRVINEDIVAPGRGFDEHPHSDMEIITVVISGALAHKDSLGNGTTISPGEVQRMTAGQGIRHSEYNASATEPCHLLQIWLRPDQRGLPPGYEQKSFAFGKGLVRVASGSGAEGAVSLHQNVELFRGQLAAGEVQRYPLTKDRHAWLQVVSGTLAVSGVALETGDGLAVSATEGLELKAGLDGASFLLFDLL